jgi:hypothetical protein
MAKEKLTTYEVGGQKITVNDVISVIKIPQSNEDMYSTTKGLFKGSEIPQELADEIDAADASDLAEEKAEG